MTITAKISRSLYATTATVGEFAALVSPRTSAGDWQPWTRGSMRVSPLAQAALWHAYRAQQGKACG